MMADNSNQAEPEAEKPPTFVDERRLGRFNIDGFLLEDRPLDALMGVMSHFLVIRAEHRFDMDAFEYVAYSPLFDPAPRGQYPPEYLLETNTLTNEVKAIKRG